MESAPFTETAYMVQYFKPISKEKRKKMKRKKGKEKMTKRGCHCENEEERAELVCWYIGIYNGKVSDKKGWERPRLIFENTI